MFSGCVICTSRSPMRATSPFALTSALPHDLFCSFVLAQPEEPGVAQLACPRPFGEADLGDEFWLDPAHVPARRLAHGEGRCRYLQLCKPAAKPLQGAPVESGSDLARVDEVAV